MLITQLKIEVRYPDCDMMGIVHHAVYPVWYEIARMDFFEKLGFSFKNMHSKGIDPPLVNLNMQYKAPAKYPGTVEIKTHILSYAQKKLELSYEVFSGDEIIAQASSFHIWTGPDMKSLNMEEALPDVYQRICEAAGAE